MTKHAKSLLYVIFKHLLTRTHYEDRIWWLLSLFDSIRQSALTQCQKKHFAAMAKEKKTLCSYSKGEKTRCGRSEKTTTRKIETKTTTFHGGREEKKSYDDNRRSDKKMK